MPFNVQDFIGNINARGTLRTNKFEVVITPPPMFAPNDAEMRHLTFRADQVKVPGISLNAYEVNRFGLGPKQKFVTGGSFTDMSVTFIEDKSHSIFKYFYNWTRSIFDYAPPSGSLPTYKVKYKGEYAARSFDIKVYSTEREGSQEPVSIISLRDAFPLTVSDTSLGWSDNNQIYKVNVSFAFTEWMIKENAQTSVQVEDLPPLPPSGPIQGDFPPGSDVPQSGRVPDTGFNIITVNPRPINLNVGTRK